VFAATLATFGVPLAKFSKMAHLRALEALQRRFFEASIQKKASLFDQEISHQWICECYDNCTRLAGIHGVPGTTQPTHLEDLIQDEVVVRHNGNLAGGCIDIEFLGYPMR
jgi:hypothetical protein